MRTPTLAQLIPNTKKFDLAKIKSVYTGKANCCCCGCSGKHTENVNSFRYVLNQVIKFEKSNGAIIDGNCAASDNDTASLEASRTYVVYFKEGVLPELIREYEMRRAVMGGSIGISDPRAIVIGGEKR